MGPADIQRYHTDATFHAQVYVTAVRACEHDTRGRGPCIRCLEVAIDAVNATPWLGLEVLSQPPRAERVIPGALRAYPNDA